jgi:hypothetical protein
MAADYKELQKYLSPETDLESFRRLPIEIAILTSEINTKIDQMERARQELEEEGLDPLDLESPPWVDYPSKNIINWIRKNPQETEQILNNPEQQDDFIFSAWKELFQSNDVVQFLSFQDRISQKIQTDAQRKKAFGTLDGLLKNASLKELSAELNKPQNKSIKKEMLEALNISKETQHLGLLRTLEQRYNSTGSSLGANVISDPENFVRLLVKP